MEDIELTPELINNFGRPDGFPAEMALILPL